MIDNKKRIMLKLLAGAGVASAAPFVWPQQRASNVVLSLGADPSFAPYIVAVRKGMFEKRGINADLKFNDDGGVALDALLTGVADIGSTVESAGIARRARGAAIFVTAMNNKASNYFGMVGDKSIKNAKDMTGKRVGLTRGGSAHLFFTVYAQHFGLDMSTLKFRYIAAPESVAALARGDVDLICIGEPWLTRALAATPGAHRIVMMGDLGIFQLTDYFYFSQRLMNDASLGKNVMSALIEAHEWVPKNFDEAAHLTAESYKVSYDTASTIMKMFTYDVTFTPEIQANMVRAFGFMKSLGLANDPPDWNTFLRPEILRATAPQRVKTA